VQQAAQSLAARSPVFEALTISPASAEKLDQHGTSSSGTHGDAVTFHSSTTLATSQQGQGNVQGTQQSGGPQGVPYGADLYGPSLAAAAMDLVGLCDETASFHVPVAYSLQQSVRTVINVSAASAWHV
jgi:hypothetical protein